MKEVNGIWLPDNDTHFEHHLKKGELVNGKGTYQLKKIKAAMKYVHPDRKRLAVDVGAHVGLWTRVLAQDFRQVFAFEPVPELIECWKMNAPTNAYLYECALSCVPGNLDMEVCGDNSGNTHVAPNSLDGTSKTISIPCTCLDRMNFEDPIDFLKIDVEGWECPVVQGAVETIVRDRPVIVIEQKPNNAERYGRKRQEALQNLLKLGYIEMWEIAGDHCLVHKSEVPAK